MEGNAQLLAVVNLKAAVNEGLCVKKDSKERFVSQENVSILHVENVITREKAELLEYDQFMSWECHALSRANALEKPVQKSRPLKKRRC